MHVLCERDRGFNIFFLCFRNEFGESNICQQTGSDTGRMSVSAKRYDRHPHPEGFAGGGGSVVGKGVKRDVNFIIEAQMLVIGLCMIHECETVLRDALDDLAGGLHELFQEEAGALLADAWAAREAYGAVFDQGDATRLRLVAEHDQ